MSDLPLFSRITTTVFVAASCLAGVEAFHQPALTKNGARSFSRQNNDLIHRNAFFGFGATTDESARLSPNSKVLIEKAKDFVDNQSGFYSDFDAEVFSEDFVFRGPVVGPLNKKDYLDTMEAFGIYRAIPDIRANAWGFSIDPQDENRVWLMVRNTGTFAGGENLVPGSLNIKPNGAKIEGTPETFSILFDEEQKIKYLSVGYVADRFDGNTKGKGAALGIFNVIGVPVPSGPLFQFTSWLGRLVGKPPLTYSNDVPEWYLKEKGTEVNYEGY